MSFFKKLKDRLTRSSSKLEEGLDAIVEEGASEPAPEPETPPADTPPAETPRPATPPDLPPVPPAEGLQSPAPV